MQSAIDLGHLCKAARKSAKLTLADLSARTGIPARSLVRLEAGDPNAPIGRVLAVLQSLGLGLDVVPITRPTLESLGAIYAEDDEPISTTGTVSKTP